jgi:hypothetical protein
MIKMTIVTDRHGNLVGAVSGHALTSRHGELEAHVSFPEGHQLHKVEVDDHLEMTKVTDATVFQAQLLKYVPRP